MTDAEYIKQFAPAYESKLLTPADIDGIEAEAFTRGPDGAFTRRMCERARGGDVSAVNACKAIIHGLL